MGTRARSDHPRPPAQERRKYQAPLASFTEHGPERAAGLLKRQADLHQPMHVTSGYYKTTLASFATKPARINSPVNAAKSGVLNDRGGNGLLFSASESNVSGLRD